MSYLKKSRIFLILSTLILNSLFSQELKINEDRFLLDNQPYDIWGVRLASGSQNLQNTQDLIANLDEYKRYGVNTITVFYMGSNAGASDPFSADGKSFIDTQNRNNMDAIIEAAAARDMVVIVGVFYQYLDNIPAPTLSGWEESKEALRTVVKHLRSKNHRNIILNIANEQNSLNYSRRELPWQRVQNISDLNDMIQIAKLEWPELIVGAGGFNNNNNDQIVVLEDLDVLLFNDGSDTSTTQGDLYTRYNAILNGQKKPMINVEMYGGWTSRFTNPAGNYSNTSGRQRHLTDATIASQIEGLSVFFHSSPWLQGPSQGEDLHFDLGGSGTANDPGIRWYFEHVANLRGIDVTNTSSDLSWNDKNEDENYEGRGECAFVQVGNKFYVLGGLESKAVEEYDYASNTWTDLGEAPFEFNHLQAIEYQGLIWVLGALQEDKWPVADGVSSVWIFDPSNSTWHEGPEVPNGRARGAAGLATYNDKIYLVAGSTDGHDGGYVAWFDEYDPKTAQWKQLPDAPRPRDHFQATVVGNELYLAGGRLSGGSGGRHTPLVPEIDVYNFSTNQWKTLPTSSNIPTSRAGASVVYFDDKLVVIGGEVFEEDVYGTIVTDAIKITEGLDLQTNMWTRIEDTKHPRHGTQAIVSGAGVYIASGSPIRGRGRQRNMEFLGQDAPQGQILIQSELTTDTNLNFDSASTQNLIVKAENGNTGIFIKRMYITGNDADDFTINSNDLSDKLLLSGSQQTVPILYSGTSNNANATLVIEYSGNTKTISLNLSGNVDTDNDVIQSFFLVNADNNSNITQLIDGIKVPYSSVEGLGLSILVNTSADPIGSVGIELNGTSLNHSQTENLAPYTLYGDRGLDDFNTGVIPIGSYTITATAYESKNKSGTVLGDNTISFEITNNTTVDNPPVASINVSTQNGEAPIAINFSSNGSTDDNQITAYSWTFGDGGTSTAANPNYTYTQVGSFTATLTVTDASGQTDTATIQIQVSEPVVDTDNEVVQSFILVNTDTSTNITELTDGLEIPYSSVEGLGLSILVNTSADPIGSVGIELNGTSLNHSQTENLAPYTLYGDRGLDDFNTGVIPIGSYTITATAYQSRSRGGAVLGVNSISFEITNPTTVDNPPAASITASTQNGETPIAINFSSNGSTDDNQITAYSWTFGDGGTSTAANPSYTYTQAGTFTARLTVRDASEQTDTASLQIQISEPVVDTDNEAVQSFILVNTDTSTNITELTDGLEIPYSTVEGLGLTILVNTSADPIGSVGIELNGTSFNHSQTENLAPYTLYGDRGLDDFNSGVIPIGSYTITATAYESKNKSGAVLGVNTISFEITNNNNTPILRLNAGGNELSFGDITYETDKYFTGGGKIFSNTSIQEIANTTQDELYKTERSAQEDLGSFGYAIPVSNGDYSLRLHFAEIFFGAPKGRPAQTGIRVFDVQIEGQELISDLDIYNETGSMAALIKEFNITVTDGILNIEFSATANRPKLSALELFGNAGNITNNLALGLAVANEEILVNLSPNPTNENITINLSGFDSSEPVFGQILGVDGVILRQYNLEYNTTLEINIGDLVTGVYILRLEQSNISVIKKIIKL